MLTVIDRRHVIIIADGSPILNLASFVHTWMPPQADKLMIENMSKNLIGVYLVPSWLRVHLLIAVFKMLTSILRLVCA
jgi:glutamate/tyrosine decarboxylase-like PLP-dependent enzyme